MKGERNLKCGQCAAVLGKVANDHNTKSTDESYFCSESCLEAWRLNEIGVKLDIKGTNPSADEIERAYRKKYFGE